MTSASGNKYIQYFILLCVSLFTTKGFSQTLPDEKVVTYVIQNKPLKIVLRELSQKTGVSITFNPRRIPQNRKISINAIKQPLGVVLNAILTPIRCRYEIIGSQIVVSRKPRRIHDHTISGYISDEESGEALVGANVYMFDKSKGTQTNEYGFYSFTLPTGTKRIYISYLGYAQDVQQIYLTRDTVMNVALKPDVLLNEIIILDDVENQEEPQAVSESKLNVDRIRTASTLGGEADVIRLVGLMPGVDSGADGLGGINVRGGSADQNLVLLDGVPIYNSSHALGLFSVFNSNVIKKATLMKGNIPARFGGRLSSVLDIRTREGNKNKFSGDVSLSALAAKASFEGPIGKNGSSFLVSGRRTFLDVWVKGITSAQNELNGDKGFSTYYFSDFNAKASLKLNKRNTLHVSGFIGSDKFGTNKQKKRPSIGNTTSDIDTETQWDWGNTLFSAKLVSQFSKKSFGRATAYFSKFDFNSFEKDDYLQFDNENSIISRSYKAGIFKSNIQDLTLKYDYDYIPNTTHTLRIGAGASLYTFGPGLVSINNSDELFNTEEPILPVKVANLIQDTNLKGQEYYTYIEDDISIGYASTINIGVRGKMTKTEKQTYISIQPRVSFLAKWENAFFRAGLSRMNQYLHLLSSNGLGLPTDVWLPSTDRLSPEKSWVASAGFGYYTSSGIRFGVEGYYKLFDELITFEEGGIKKISSEVEWERQIPVGKGHAYGIETNFDHIIGRSTWNFNYTLSFAFREFKGINIDDEPFPFRYNRLHNAKLGFLHKLTDNTEFTLNWNLASGNPITAPKGQVVLGPSGELLLVYDAKNNSTLPAYHRLDLAFNFYNKYKWGRSKLSIGVYNAFNRNNPFYIDVENVAENPSKFQLVKYSVLPIIPNIGYSISF